jgi:hypothetical protein
MTVAAAVGGVYIERIEILLCWLRFDFHHLHMHMHRFVAKLSSSPGTQMVAKRGWEDPGPDQKQRRANQLEGLGPVTDVEACHQRRANMTAGRP